VPVGIHGDLDGMVSHLILDAGEGFAGPDEPGGEGVLQVVEADMTEPSFFEGAPRSGVIRGRAMRMPALSPGLALSRSTMSV
jgi:hypothetical protein